ncbi:MAG: T9SS type A sorting domain-containing protein [Methanococcaceae archaeon]
MLVLFPIPGIFSQTPPHPRLVELKVYNMLGSIISTLVSTEQAAGKYKTQFDGSALSSGVYIYSIKTQKFRRSKKLILLE